MSPATPRTRADVFSLLAEASHAGSLGLFVGSGFGRAVAGPAAPTFEGLLFELVDRLGLSADTLREGELRFRSYPQVASAVLSAYQESNPGADRPAGRVFRETIAQICHLHPLPHLRAALNESLNWIGPSWVITTNYDLLLESLFDHSSTLLPDQPFVGQRNRVPILHLHGHRLDPDSIRVTEEDYVELMGPINYQRLKLPLVLAESTTLMLGYSLGDMNVRAANAWAKSLGLREGLNISSHHGRIVLALYSPEEATDSCAVGPNGEIIIETNDLPELLKTIGEECESYRENFTIARSVANDRIAKHYDLLSPDGKERSRFVTAVMLSSTLADPVDVAEFVTTQLEPLWLEARRDGNWHRYTDYVDVLIELLQHVDFFRCHQLVQLALVDALARVAPFFTGGRRDVGSPWAARDRWVDSRGLIPERVLVELREAAKARRQLSLEQILAPDFS